MYSDACAPLQERDVSESKKRVDSVTSEAQSAAESRDKAEREIAALQATILRESAQFESEFTTKIAVRVHLVVHAWHVACQIAGSTTPCKIVRLLRYCCARRYNT